MLVCTVLAWALPAAADHATGAAATAWVSDSADALPGTSENVRAAAPRVATPAIENLWFLFRRP